MGGCGHEPSGGRIQSGRLIARNDTCRRLGGCAGRSAADSSRPVVRLERRGYRKYGSAGQAADDRSEEHTSELQSLMRTSYAVFCLKKKNETNKTKSTHVRKNEQ